LEEEVEQLIGLPIDIARIRSYFLSILHALANANEHGVVLTHMKHNH